MMKTKFSLILMLFGILLGACKQDALENEIDPEDTTLVLKFPRRLVADSLTTRAKYPANAQESLLQQVTAYVFTDQSGNPGTLIASFPAELGGSTTDGVAATFDITDLEYGTYQLVAVANHAVTTVDDMPFNDFCDQIVTQFPAGDSEFAMSATPRMFEYTLGVVPEVDPIELVRLAARIDIKNDATTETNPFVLTHVRIRNAVDRSYLIHRGMSQVIGTGTAVDKNPGWVENDKTAGVYDAEMFAKLYVFENDEVAPSAVQTYLEVKGTYKGETVHFSIPFADKPILRNTRYLVTIQKVSQSGLVFDITVKDWEEGEEIYFNPYIPRPLVSRISPIQPDKTTVLANKIVGDYEGVKLSYESGAPSETFQYLEKMTLPFWRTRYDFETCFSEELEVVVKDAATYADTWVCETESGETTAAGTSPDANGVYKQKFRIVFEANDLPDEQARELTLIVRSKTTPAFKKEIKVRQIALPDLMSYVSPYLNGLNSFGPEVTVDKIGTDELKPAYFQWGRNVPLYGASDEDVVTVTSLRNDDPLLFTEKTYYKPTTVSSYLYPDATAANGGAQDYYNILWPAFVMRSQPTNASDPDWIRYKGTNTTYEGDPCPQGWHIPTNKYEWYALGLGYKTRKLSGFSGTWDIMNFFEIYDSGTPPALSTEGVQYANILENAHIYGWKQKGGAYYDSPYNTNVFYAIKHVYRSNATTLASGYMYENALRTAFKYEWLDKAGYSYVKITARHIGEDPVVTTAVEGMGEANLDKNYQKYLRTVVAKDTYWASDNSRDKVLIFPTFGALSCNAAATETVLSGVGAHSYEYSGNLLSKNSARVLRIGAIANKAKYYPPHTTFSNEWSFGTASGFVIRCIKNAPVSELNEAFSWPTE